MAMQLPTEEDLKKDRAFFITIGYARKEEVLRARDADENGGDGDISFERELILSQVGEQNLPDRLQADHMVHTLLSLLRTWNVEVVIARRNGDEEFNQFRAQEQAANEGGSNNATH